LASERCNVLPEDGRCSTPWAKCSNLKKQEGMQARRTAMTIAEILQQAKTLSVQERKELVKLLVDSLDMPEAVSRQPRRLSELRGLGKEIWEGIDAQEYVNQLRREWDERP
jgi:hypothetical protein